MTQPQDSQGYSLRTLQSLLGISRRALQGLIAAGFVQPTRGARNELRFSYQDLVVLRTAFQLRSANISTQRIRQALSRVRRDISDAQPLSCIRLTAVGNAVAVKQGALQWDVTSGQLLLDLEGAPEGGVTSIDHAASKQMERRAQATYWFMQAEELHEHDPSGAERAYRKALELAPELHIDAYNNLGELLSRSDERCEEALAVFDQALQHFAQSDLLHYNRAVLLERLAKLEEAAASYLQSVTLNPHNEDAHYGRATTLERLGRLEEAEMAYRRCLELNPSHEHALIDLVRLSEVRGDEQTAIRHLSAWRRAGR